MKKMLFSFAISAMFFITGFSVVSAGTVNQTYSVDYEPPAHWEKPKAYFSLHNWSEEDLEITVNDEPVDNFTYFINKPSGKFKNVNITFYQKEYLSLAWTYYIHPFFMFKWGIMFKVMLKIIPKFFANIKNFDNIMDEVFTDAFFEVIQNNPNILYYFKEGYSYHIHIGTLSNVNPYSLKNKNSGFFQYDMSNTIEFDGKDTVIIDLIKN